MYRCIVIVLLVALFVILPFVDGIAQSGYTISGYVKDAENGEDMINAVVYVQELKTGTTTNLYGFYSLTLPLGSYTIEYRFLGYQTRTESIELGDNTRLDVELSTEGVQIEEVVVYGEAENANIETVEMSTQKLDIATIQRIPPFLGETDILKSIQLLPGVTTVGEGSSGFNVRGGNVGQNLVLQDEAPVYNSSHLLGFFSVFNPDAVKDVKLFKGGVPAKYGGRLASILDIRLKEGNSKSYDVAGGIGTVFSRLAVEGPIVKDKASFFVAGRRSYADVFAKLFTDVLDDGAALNFWDITAKVNYDINENNRVFVSGYFGRDIFRFDSRQGFSWGSRTGTARWNHLFNDRLFSNLSLIYSEYDYELAFGENDRDKFEWNSKIQTYDLKPEFTYFINTRNELSFGGEFLWYKFQPANAVGVSAGQVTDISVDRKRGLESALYVSNEQEIGSNITLEYGLRFSSFLYLGPTTVYEFGESEPGTRKPVTSAERADDWELIADYYNLEPRFSMKYQFSPSMSVKASYNRIAQYIHLISNTVASNPLDVWTPSTNNIKPQIGHQVALGIFKNFRDNGFETSVETYYRPTLNQVEYIDGADILINDFLEGDLLSGRGRAYGAEFYVKKNYGKINGWISYTLGWTELKTEGINGSIDAGVPFDWYPTRFDQRHNLKVTALYDLNERVKFSATFTYLTGTPTTYPNAKYFQETLPNIAIPYLEDNQRNNVRITDYHRMDLSCTIEGKKFKKGGKKRKNEDYWVISIYNLYGRNNPFSEGFNQDLEPRISGEDPYFGPTQGFRFSVIGTIFPSVSYNFRF
jgi:hypothetical protein